MPFVLAIVQRPKEEEGRMNQWLGFPEYATAQNIKQSSGVYGVGQNAWIFNLKDAIPQYASVITLANDLGLQIHLFQLEDASIKSHVCSWPRSGDLDKFLATP